MEKENKMIYKIYCKINKQFVSNKINHGAQYAFFSRNRKNWDGHTYTDLELADLITTKNGKTWITLSGANSLCNNLNKILPDTFEIKE